MLIMSVDNDHHHIVIAVKLCTIKAYIVLEYIHIFRIFTLWALWFDCLLFFFKNITQVAITFDDDDDERLQKHAVVYSNKIFFVWRIKRFKADRENVSLIKSLPLLAFIFIALSSFIKNIFYTMYHLLTACTRVHVQIRVNLSIRW